MGLSSAGNEFNRVTDSALEGIGNLKKIVDDVLIDDNDMEEHLARVRRFLERCREHGITLNQDKFKLAQSSVSFAGYIVGVEGIKAGPEKVKAIQHFPKPTNITACDPSSLGRAVSWVVDQNLWSYAASTPSLKSEIRIHVDGGPRQSL
ncbi:Uncharacterized protein FKW44_002300 [Caligus rogercresseyi]|uniref:Reverse transcriptase domain-containing protein n=1 Tax=Caligus rogercresseyi TaxID=217165 RepID=A0A7T8QW82_CALRO|nr:Uncharacterized protein FKW44_002300 [Caligus rogercresseyi]